MDPFKLEKRYDNTNRVVTFGVAEPYVGVMHTTYFKPRKKHR